VNEQQVNELRLDEQMSKNNRGGVPLRSGVTLRASSRLHGQQSAAWRVRAVMRSELLGSVHLQEYAPLRCTLRGPLNAGLLGTCGRQDAENRAAAMRWIFAGGAGKLRQSQV
jgi:hypothetical protein